MCFWLPFLLFLITAALAAYITDLIGKSKLSSLEKDAADQRQQYTALQNQYNTSTDNLNALETNYNSLKADHDALIQSTKNYKDQSVEKQSADTALRSEYDQLTLQHKELAATIEHWRNKYEAKASDYTQLKETNKQLLEESNTLGQALKNEKSELSAIAAAHSALKDRCDHLVTEIDSHKITISEKEAALDKKLQEVNATVDTSEQAVNKWKTKYKKIQSELENYKTEQTGKWEVLQQEKNTLLTQISNQKKEWKGKHELGIGELDKLKKKNKAAIKEKSQEITALKESAADLEAKYKEIKSKIKTLEESHALDLKANDQQIKALKAASGDWEAKYNEIKVLTDNTTEEKEALVANWKGKVKELKKTIKSKDKDIDLLHDRMQLWKSRYRDTDTLLKEASTAVDDLSQKVEAAKEGQIEVIKEVEKIVEIEVIKEIPVEIIKEVEVVKHPDMEELKAMMQNMSSSEATTIVKEVDQTEVKKSKKDNLKRIEGIGPKIEELLHNAGIITYESLANADLKTLEKILQEAGARFRMHDPTTWSPQAKLAARGDWKSLKKWQDELDGGRKK